MAQKQTFEYPTSPIRVVVLKRGQQKSTLLISDSPTPTNLEAELWEPHDPDKPAGTLTRNPSGGFFYQS